MRYALALALVAAMAAGAGDAVAKEPNGGQRPVLTLQPLGKQHAMTFPTATKAMQSLIAAGIVRELTGQRRNRVFVYDAYLTILNEGGQPL